jgi:hypothetical protein
MAVDSLFPYKTSLNPLFDLGMDGKYNASTICGKDQNTNLSYNFPIAQGMIVD